MAIGQKLTKSRIDALPIPESGQEFHWDSETKGFGIRVTANGKKAYVVQSRVNGKVRRVTLGPHGLLTCDEARKRALAQLLDMYDGKDPQEAKRKDDALNITLCDVMADYLVYKKTKKGGLRDRTKQDIERHITKTFGDWADKPVIEITRDACVKKFRKLSETGPVQANQAFRILRALLNWARESNATEDGEYPLLPINPVASMIKSNKLNPEKPRNDRRVPLDKLGETWNALQQARLVSTEASRSGVDLIIFLLLTGARLGEASRLKWANVNLRESPPWFRLTDTKNHNDVTIPLSPVLHELLQLRFLDRDKKVPYVFTAPNNPNEHIRDARSVMAVVSKIAGKHLSNHDLRRTFLSIAYECSVEMWKAELLTNHVPTAVTVKHYTETSDLRYLADEVGRIAQYIIDQAALLVPDTRM